MHAKCRAGRIVTEVCAVAALVCARIDQLYYLHIGVAAFTGGIKLLEIVLPIT